MYLLDLRRLFFLLILIVPYGYILMIWLGKFSFFPSAGLSESHIDSIIGTVIQTTSSICGIIIALIFITAQLAVNKPYVIRNLYKGFEIYTFILYFIVTLFIGYITFPLLPKIATNRFVFRLANTTLVLAIASIFLIFPVLILQIENMIPNILASKLARKLKPIKIIEYGLTDVHVISAEPSIVNYQLITVGLNPKHDDPFRPLHEVIMEAVSARDRVLFGKLFLHFLTPVAAVHNLRWQPRFIVKSTKQGLNLGFRTSYTFTQKIHISLAIFHYAVKRARNLRSEWESRDIGRHGILNGIGQLVLKLCDTDESNVSIKIAIYAVLHVTKEYRDINPYGRIEPLNIFFLIASRLELVGKKMEASLCIEVLAWIAIRTKQITERRSAGMLEKMTQEMQAQFNSYKIKAQAELDWMPGIAAEDPWREWPSNQL